MTEIDFTGERLVPGKAPSNSFDDHLARYDFACRYAQDKRVLDIACGVGYGSDMLRRAGAAHVDGVDISADTIQYATEKYREENLCFAMGDIASYQSSGKYDLIVCFETIEHIASYKDALINLKSLLEHGGTLIISSPNRLITSPRNTSRSDKPRNRFHCQEFSVDELVACLTAAGFVIDPPVHGQRHQRRFGSRLMKNIYRSLLRPGVRFAPEVTPIRPGKAPRFIVVVCRSAL